MRILISSGPTREPLDPVRFLSNYSTGYMGAQLAAASLARGHRVTVVSGPATEPLPVKARVIRVERAAEMARALNEAARSADVVIMAAAVSDFRPSRRSAASKLSRRGALHLALEATPDIIARLPRRPRQVVVGFALETHGVVARANAKLRAKRLDLVLAQQVRHDSALHPERRRGTQRANGTEGPFGRHPVRAWLLSRDGNVEPLGMVSKPKVARVLLDKIEALWYGQRDKNLEGLRGLKKAKKA